MQVKFDSQISKLKIENIKLKEKIEEFDKNINLGRKVSDIEKNIKILEDKIANKEEKKIMNKMNNIKNNEKDKKNVNKKLTPLNSINNNKKITINAKEEAKNKSRK